MRKKSTRLLSAALAACMMLSVLPVGAFAAEPGTEPENGNGVSAQAEETLPFAGKEITEGGTYTMEGGEYTGPITVNVQDGKDVIINITGSVTTSIEDMLIKVVKGHVTINGGNNVTVENTREEKGYSDGIGYVLIGLSSTDDNTTVEINGGTYKRTLGAAVGCAYSSKGTLTIISGTFETGMGGAVENVASDSAAVMQIEEGTFIGGQACKDNRATHALANYGTTIINGGVFQGYDGSAVYQHMGELQIHGGTFESMNPENTVIDIEDGPSKTTITGGYFSNVQSSRWGHVVYYSSYMGYEEQNGLFITGGTFEIKGEDVDGIYIPYTKGPIIIENATIKVNATSGKGAGIVRRVDSDDVALKVKNVTIENAGASGNFSDILLDNYRPGPVDFEITEDFTHKAVVDATEIEDGLQVTTKTATHYQKDLKLVSANPGYIIDYQKDGDGTEYRYFNTREMDKYYVNPINATMTADGEEKRPYSQFAQGDKVTLTANIPEGKQFVDWKVEKIAAEGVEDVSEKVKIDYEDPENPETATLTVPDYDIFVTAEYKEGVIIDPGTSDTDYGGDIAAGVVIGGIAAVGAYEVGTGLYRITQMDDVAMPTNRLALAKLLWERAGKPEPEGTALYSDISAEDTNAQKAARWAVEQELLNDDDSVEGELKFHPAFPVSKLRVCLTWEKAKQKGLFDQNTEA